MSHPGATATDRHKVVIIGSGFGGLNAAQKLKKTDVDIKLIARTTHHLFQPLLYQVATGIISEGEIAPPTRLILRKQENAQVLLGDVTHIDLENQTVTSELLGHDYKTPYDTLIIAAGAGQSYFGNDHFAEFAPGMKSIDDALELRGRILGAFEQAERSSDPVRRAKLLTFVVVGAGPTGVEMAGQIQELADQTLRGSFRHIDPTEAHVILLDAAPAVLPPMGKKLGLKAQERLEKMGVEVQLNAMVTNVDYQGVTVKDKDGDERRIECACKVWSAGVQASPLGKMLADQSDGTETDRAGRVVVEPDLSVTGHPHVFVVGDLMSVPGVPGMAQGAIQGAKYATNVIKRSVAGHDDPTNRAPFKYFDKGSMATISRFSAVAQVGKLEFGGFIAWLAWLVLHLVYLVGFKNRFTTLITWFITFLGHSRGQMAITSQMIYARLAMDMLQNQQKQQLRQSPLAAVEEAEKLERERGVS
jgi:NADH:ubiquinone reductase (H+-translocating)